MLQIGSEKLYPAAKNSGSRMIKTPVSLFSRKSDTFSHNASKRTAKIEGMPNKYKGKAK